MIENFGSIDKIKIKDTPIPIPSADEVQIEVRAAGVNPVEWKITEGYLKDLLPHVFPIILGWDAAGVISQVGSSVKNLKVGDEVYAYCRKPVVQWGTFAEFVCFTAEHVALKPKNLSFAQAAAIPLVALTAWQALFDLAKVSKGQKVLIHAGAGGVGGMAIQLAKNAGATVYTTASKNNHAYVQKLGADVAIDYNQEDFVQGIKKLAPDGLDMIFDCVGKEVLNRSYECVKKGGWIISIVNEVNPSIAKQKGFHAGNVFVRPNGGELKQITTLIESGKVIAPQVQEMQMQDAIKALQQIKTEHTRGKISLKMR